MIIPSVLTKESPKNYFADFFMMPRKTFVSGRFFANAALQNGKVFFGHP
jgi:hypothetical protein